MMKDKLPPPAPRRSALFCVTVVAIVFFGVLTFYGDFLNGSAATSGLVAEKLPVLYVDKAASCETMKMFGDANDAGWWVCWPEGFQPTKQNCKVLSWGVQNHFSFDEAMVRIGCEVHGFDPSPLALASNTKYSQMGGSFHSYGLGFEDKTYGPGDAPFNYPGIKYMRGSNSDPWTLRTIPTALKDTGSTSERMGQIVGSKDNLVLLKIDTEGMEWSVIDHIVASDWDQLLVELHFNPAEYHLSDVGGGRGFVITRLPQSGLGSYLFPPKLDYIALWQRVMRVGDMWQYSFNLNDRARSCLEVYLTRKPASGAGA